MVKVELKGIHKVTVKGRDYWYAWKGPPNGPRLRGEPGSPEFVASFFEAHENLRAPDASRFRSLVVAYRASTDFNNLAPITKKNWSPWLDRAAEHFGDLRIAQFDRTVKIRPIIIRGAINGPPRRARPTLRSKSYRACVRTPSIRSASFRRIRARASRHCIASIAAN